MKYILAFLLLGSILLQGETLTQNGTGYQTNTNDATAKTSKVVTQSGTNVLNAADSDDKFKILNVDQTGTGTQINSNVADAKEINQDGLNVGDSISINSISKKANITQDSDILQRNYNTATGKSIEQITTNVANTIQVKTNKGDIYQNVSLKQANKNVATSRETIKQTAVNVGNSTSFK